MSIPYSIYSQVQLSSISVPSLHILLLYNGLYHSVLIARLGLLFIHSTYYRAWSSGMEEQMYTVYEQYRRGVLDSAWEEVRLL
jgi:hypothetical protein